MRHGSRKKATGIIFLVVVGAVAAVSQACGSGSATVAATPTARPLPSRVAAEGTPGFRVFGTLGPDFTPGAFGTPGAGGFFFQGAADSGLADFLGISQDELTSELQADGATMATVADAHGKTRDELKAFLTDQLTQSTQQAVSDGRMSQDQADTMLQDLSARVDQMIDGTMRFQFGGPPGVDVTPSQ
jgi:hypothetical protein